MLNLARQCLEPGFRKDPQKTAVMFVTPSGNLQAMNYAQLFETVGRLSAVLREEVPQSASRILIRLPHGMTYLLSMLAVVASGHVAIPVSPLLTDREVEQLCADSQPAFYWDEKNNARLQQKAAGAADGFWSETTAEDPCLMLYTSGTTREPKGVVHAQRMILGRIPMRAGWTGIGPHDVVLHAGQLNWTYTFGVAILDTLNVCGTAILCEKALNPADWFALMERCAVTVFAAVPALYRRMLKYGEPSAHHLAALRHGLTAGESLSPQLLEEWQMRTRKPLYEALGMTEVSTFVSSGPATAIKPGSPGKAQPGRQITVLPLEETAAGLTSGEVGLLAVHRSDPGLMLGYWRRPMEEADAFRGDWFVSGDLASIDAEGYVWHHGRHDDVLKISGYRLSPQEIEAVIAECNGVAEVACAALPVASGQILAAFVVMKEGASADAEKIMEHARANLAIYKQPREIRFVQQLPRSANGKLLRRKL